MRYLARTGVLAVALAALGSRASAQLYNFPPTVDYVGSTSSVAPGPVNVVGSHLGLVDLVTVDGVPVEVIRLRDHRITILPEPGMPGFHLVEVRNNFGVAAGMLELTPTVSGDRLGNLMDVRIANGSAGTCVLYYGTALLDEPVIEQGVGFGRLLDFDRGLSGGVFTARIFTASPVFVQKLRIPRDIATTGLGFYIQGLCEQGFPEEGSTTKSFTNVGTVPARPGSGSH